MVLILHRTRVMQLEPSPSARRSSMPSRAFPTPVSPGINPLTPTVIRTTGLSRSINLLSRSEEHTSELQSHLNLVCRLLLEKKKTTTRAPRASAAVREPDSL